MHRKWFLIVPIILVLLGTCLLMLFITLMSLRQAGPLSFHLPGFGANSVSATFDEKQVLTPSNPANLKVENDFGDIHIVGGTGSQIEISAHKTAQAASRPLAQAALEKLKYEVTQTDGGVQVRVVRPYGVIANGPPDRIDFTITVPSQTSVTASTNSGGLSLNDLEAAADLTTQVGDIDVSVIKNASLKAVSHTGQVSVSLFQAPAQDIFLSTDLGNVSLESSDANQVQLQSINGEVRLQGVNAAGPVSLKSDFGSTDYESGKLAALTVSSKNGRVDLIDLILTGAVKVDSDLGSIALERVLAGSYELGTHNGDITLNTCSGAVRASTAFGGIEIRNADNAVLNLDTQSGNIAFDGSLGQAESTLRSDLGAVQLSLPAATALNFDLKSQFGQITSDFDVSIQGSPQADHWVGVINGGNSSSKLTVVTHSGNIELQKLSQ